MSECVSECGEGYLEEVEDVRLLVPDLLLAALLAHVEDGGALGGVLVPNLELEGLLPARVVPVSHSLTHSLARSLPPSLPPSLAHPLFGIVPIGLHS